MGFFIGYLRILPKEQPRVAPYDMQYSLYNSIREGKRPRENGRRGWIRESGGLGGGEGLRDRSNFFLIPEIMMRSMRTL